MRSDRTEARTSSTGFTYLSSIEQSVAMIKDALIAIGNETNNALGSPTAVIARYCSSLWRTASVSTCIRQKMLINIFPARIEPQEITAIVTDARVHISRPDDELAFFFISPLRARYPATYRANDVLWKFSRLQICPARCFSLSFCPFPEFSF